MKPPGPYRAYSDDCLRVSVAALLELEVEQVPHFVHESKQTGRYWVDIVREWAEFEGYEMTYQRHHDGPFPRHHFVGIIAPHSAGKCHAVVMKGSKVVYDCAAGTRQRYQKKGIYALSLVDPNA